MSRQSKKRQAPNQGQSNQHEEQGDGAKAVCEGKTVEQKENRKSEKSTNERAYSLRRQLPVDASQLRVIKHESNITVEGQTEDLSVPVCVFAAH